VGGGVFGEKGARKADMKRGKSTEKLFHRRERFPRKRREKKSHRTTVKRQEGKNGKRAFPEGEL